MAHRAPVPSLPCSGVVQGVTASVRAARAFTGSVLASSVRRAVRTPGRSARGEPATPPSGARLPASLPLPLPRREACAEPVDRGHSPARPADTAAPAGVPDGVDAGGLVPRARSRAPTGAAALPQAPRAWRTGRILEPNPAYHPFFIACCERNRELQAELHGVAVGARTGSVELAIPGDQTYLGTVTATGEGRWAGRSDVTTRTCPRSRSMASSAEVRQVRCADLIIDVEGSELGVLEGADRLAGTGASGARARELVGQWRPRGRVRAARVAAGVRQTREFRRRKPWATPFRCAHRRQPLSESGSGADPPRAARDREATDGARRGSRPARRARSRRRSRAPADSCRGDRVRRRRARGRTPSSAGCRPRDAVDRAERRRAELAAHDDLGHSVVICPRQKP